MPQREWAVEETNGSKGYRIVPSLNPRMSAIETALAMAGIAYYMPAENKLVRDRRHTDLWKPRRFPLIVGYVFIKGPFERAVLDSVPGVQGVVGAAGTPLEIDIRDILTLRSMEALSEERFDRDALRARKTIRAKLKRNPRLKQIVEKLERAEHFTLPLESAVYS